MAFRFNWPRFDSDFLQKAQDQISLALNRDPANRPPKIADRIEVKELNLGSQPPELEMLEIGELTEEKFRGIFKLTYAGDAYLILQTKVQLRISRLRLRGTAALVVDRTKGVTLSFKTDPLESVVVSSTFDGVEGIRRTLQRQIEGQLRKLFTDDLPTVIHALSLQVMGPRQPGPAGGAPDAPAPPQWGPAAPAAPHPGAPPSLASASSSSGARARDAEDRLDRLARAAARADPSPARPRSGSVASSAGNGNPPGALAPLSEAGSAAAGPPAPPAPLARPAPADPPHMIHLDSGFFGDLVQEAERYYFLHGAAPAGPANPPAVPPAPAAAPAPHERWWSAAAVQGGAGPVAVPPLRRAKWAGNEAWEALADIHPGGLEGEYVLHRGLATPLAGGRGRGRGAARAAWGAPWPAAGVVGLLVPGPGAGLAGVGDLAEQLDRPAALQRGQVRGLGARGGDADGADLAAFGRSPSVDGGLWAAGRALSGTESVSEGSEGGRRAGHALGHGYAHAHAHSAGGRGRGHRRDGSGPLSPGGASHPPQTLANHHRSTTFPALPRARSTDFAPLLARAREGPAHAAPDWRHVRPLHPPVRRPLSPEPEPPRSPRAEPDLSRPVTVAPGSRPAARLRDLSAWPLTISPLAGLPELVAVRTAPRPPGRARAAAMSPAHASTDDLRASMGGSRTSPVARRVRRVKLAATPVPGVGLWPSTSTSPAASRAGSGPASPSRSPSHRRGPSRSLSASALSASSGPSDAGSEDGWEGAAASTRSEPGRRAGPASLADSTASAPAGGNTVRAGGYAPGAHHPVLGAPATLAISLRGAPGPSPASAPAGAAHPHLARSPLSAYGSTLPPELAVQARAVGAAAAAGGAASPAGQRPASQQGARVVRRVGGSVAEVWVR